MQTNIESFTHVLPFFLFGFHYSSYSEGEAIHLGCTALDQFVSNKVFKSHIPIIVETRGVITIVETRKVRTIVDLLYWKYQHCHTDQNLIGI